MAEIIEHEIERDIKEFNNQLLSYKNNQNGCDVDVVLHGQRHSLHSIILAASSNYFDEILFNDSPVPKEVILNEVDPEIAMRIIDYCYIGYIVVEEKEISDVLVVAKYLKVKNIVQGCSDLLKTALTVENFFEFWNIAQNHDLEDLLLSCYEFFLEHSTEISEFRNENTNPDISVEMVQSGRSLHKRDTTHVIKLPKTEIPETINVATEKGTNSSTIVIVGGDDKNQANIVEIYDKTNDIWIKKDVQINIGNFASVLFKNEILIMGGYAGGALDIVESYDLKTFTKTTLAPLNQKRFYFKAVVVGDYVYVIGGDSLFGNYLSSTERYDSLTGSWTEMASMPTSRSEHGAAVVDNEIFVIGGNDKNNLAINECYSVETGKWRTCMPMKEERSNPGVAAVNGFIYAVGGYGGQQRLSSVEKYDPSIDAWSYISSISPSRTTVTAVGLDGNLIISGGFSNMNLKLVEQYDPEKAEWTTLSPLNIVRRNHNMIEVPLNLLE